MHVFVNFVLSDRDSYDVCKSIFLVSNERMNVLCRSSTTTLRKKKQ